MKGFIETHGRPFVALLVSVFAWVSVFVTEYLRAFLEPRLDSSTILAAAGVLTGAATSYAAIAGYVKAKNAEAGIQDE